MSTTKVRRLPTSADPADAVLVAWWGLTLAKAYQQYGDATYLGAAKAIQAADTSNITSSCGGAFAESLARPPS